MSKLTQITFTIRPFQGRKINVIEVHSVSADSFLELLKPVCSDLNATSSSKDTVDFAQHVIQFQSDIGSFYISFPEWGGIFIDSGIHSDKSNASNSTLDLLAKALCQHAEFEQKYLSYPELREYVGHIRDYESPFSEIEIEFIRLGIIKLQKFINSDEPSESHKPILQRNIDAVKRLISSSDIVKPNPSFKARYWWDEYRRANPPKDNIHALTQTLTLMVQGGCRILNEDERQYRITYYNLSEGI